MNQQECAPRRLPALDGAGPGIVLNRDGSFQRTARFRGPDLHSAAPAELVAVAGRLNNAFRRLGSGWAIFVEAQRHPSNSYPSSVFPDSASALVDAERKADFEEAGGHFESSYFLTTSGGTWIMPPIFAQVSALPDELNGLFWAADSASSVRAGGS